MSLARTVSKVVGLVATAICCTVAVACPSNQYESCIFNACVCLPKCGGAICDGVQHIKDETTGQVGGAALEALAGVNYLVRALPHQNCYSC